ncbi:hypothetical protein OC861_003552 [Tilletia horrida]|nr:hypothetical protein OC861_003552 [Tilletia horrida]
MAEIKLKLAPRDHIDPLENVDAALTNFRQDHDAATLAAQTELHELTNKVNNLRAECSRSALDWISHDEHLARTDELEREQLEWTKKMAGDEAKLKQLEAELRECKEECAMWEEVDVDEEVDFSGDALALRFFRNLGFVPSYNSQQQQQTQTQLTATSKRKSATGVPLAQAATFDRLLVRSESTGRASMFDVTVEGREAKGWSEKDLTDQLWRAAT